MQLQEAERPEPVVDGDDDGRAVGGEEGAVIVGAAAGDEGAAMDEELDRQRVIRRRRPDVQAETGFLVSMIEMAGLRRVSAVVRALARLRPRERRCRPGKAPRGRERHALEGAYAVLLGADDRPAGGRNCVGQHATFTHPDSSALLAEIGDVDIVGFARGGR